MGVEVNQVPKGLDRDDHSWDRIFYVQGRLEELLETLVGTLAELSQQLSIKSEMGPDHLGDSKDILPVR